MKVWCLGITAYLLALAPVTVMMQVGFHSHRHATTLFSPRSGMITILPPDSGWRPAVIMPDDQYILPCGFGGDVHDAQRIMEERRLSRCYERT